MDMEQHNPIPPGTPDAESAPMQSESSPADPDSAHGGGAADPTCSESRGARPPKPARTGCWRQLLRNLLNGVRLALLLRVDPEEFFAAPGNLALLALCDFFGNLVVSFFLVGRGGSFAYSAVPGFFFHLPLLLFCGYLVGALVGRPSLVGVLPAALVALSIPIELFHGALERRRLANWSGWTATWRRRTITGSSGGGPSRRSFSWSGSSRQRPPGAWRCSCPGGRWSGFFGSFPAPTSG